MKTKIYIIGILVLLFLSGIEASVPALDIETQTVEEDEHTSGNGNPEIYQHSPMADDVLYYTDTRDPARDISMNAYDYDPDSDPDVGDEGYIHMEILVRMGGSWHTIVETQGGKERDGDHYIYCYGGRGVYSWDYPFPRVDADYKIRFIVTDLDGNTASESVTLSVRYKKGKEITGPELMADQEPISMPTVMELEQAPLSEPLTAPFESSSTGGPFVEMIVLLDTDGDGYPDEYEISQGSDPCDSTSYPESGSGSQGSDSAESEQSSEAGPLRNR